MRKALKPFAYLAALIPVFMPRVASAETVISTATTTPINTATPHTGNVGPADDVRISSAGAIQPTSGFAVNLNSNNTVTNEGLLNIVDSNNSTGIQVNGGFTGAVTNNGSIAILENYTFTDTDNDGDADGPFAKPGSTGRIGIHVTGASPFTGNITQGTIGAINIEGNSSYGILVDQQIIGNKNVLGVGTVGLDIAGGIAALGDGVYGIRTMGAGTINGGINYTGNMAVSGLNAIGVSIEAPVTGQAHFQGSIQTDGYRFQSRPTDAEIAKFEHGDDDLQSGPAVSITADVGGGVLFDAPPPDLDTNVADEDADGVADAAETISNLVAYGQGPAVQIGSSAGHITLGNVAGPLAYGLINKGAITDVGILDNIPTTGVSINRASLNGGFYNSGTILAGSFQATTESVLITGDSELGAIVNTGTITNNYVEQSAAGGQVGRAIHIGSGVNTVTGALSFNNSGTIDVANFGANHDSFGVVDDSGRLTSVTNTGVVRVLRTTDATVVGKNVAFDLSANTTGVNITQLLSSVTGAGDPAIIGDIRFGTGSDTLDVQKGGVGGNTFFGAGADHLLLSNASTLVGDVSFGAGADTLAINSGASLTGSLDDSDNQLSIDVANGTLDLRNQVALASTAVTASSLHVGSAGKIFVSIDPTAGLHGSIGVAGASGATFDAGSSVSILLKSALPGGPGVPVTYNLFNTTGGTITGAPNATLTDAPFVYNSQVVKNLANTSVDLTLSRKTAAQIGLNANETAFYEPFFQNALAHDTTLMQSVLGLGTKSTFTAALDQAMPDTSGAQVEFATSRSQALTQMMFARYMTPVRRDREVYAWANELSYMRDREQTSLGTGYDGFGFGFAFGIDGPMGRTGYKGIGFALSSDEVNEKAGADRPFTVTTGEVTAHIAQPIGSILFGARLGAGADAFKSKRQVVFTPDLTAPGVAQGPQADWHGGHVSGALRAAYITHAGPFAIRPEVGVDAVSMWEQAYTETGGGAGLNLAVDSRNTIRANASSTLELSVPFQHNGFAFTPALTLGARMPLLKDPYEVNGHFVSSPATKFTLASDPIDSPALIAGLGFEVNGQIGSFRIEGQAEKSDGETTATGRMVLRLTF